MACPHEKTTTPSELGASAPLPATPPSSPLATTPTMRRNKKLSHPDRIFHTGPDPAMRGGQRNAAQGRHGKKLSLCTPSTLSTPSAAAGLPTFSFLRYAKSPDEEEEMDFTKSLETAVRKISRGTSPSHLRTSPNPSSPANLGGLSGQVDGRLGNQCGLTKDRLLKALLAQFGQ